MPIKVKNHPVFPVTTPSPPSDEGQRGWYWGGLILKAASKFVFQTRAKPIVDLVCSQYPHDLSNCDHAPGGQGRVNHVHRQAQGVLQIIFQGVQLDQGNGGKNKFHQQIQIACAGGADYPARRLSTQAGEQLPCRLRANAR